jgi:hypothetical protein
MAGYLSAAMLSKIALALALHLYSIKWNQAILQRVSVESEGILLVLSGWLKMNAHQDLCGLEQEAQCQVPNTPALPALVAKET